MNRHITSRCVRKIETASNSSRKYTSGIFLKKIEGTWYSDIDQRQLDSVHLLFILVRINLDQFDIATLSEFSYVQ